MQTKTPEELKEIGNGFFDSGKFNEALKYYSLAIERNSFYTEAYDLRGVTRFQLFQIEQAKEDLLTAIGITPDYHLAYYHLGELEVSLHNFPLAENYIEKALSIENGNVIYLTYYAFIKLSLNKDQECIDACNTILQDYPNDKWALEYRASSYLRLEKFQESIKDYIKLLEGDRTNGFYFNNIGYAYSKMGYLEKARKNLLLAIDLNPGNAYPYNNLGFVCYLEKDFAGALELINKSLTLDSSNSYAYKNRALVYSKTNKKELAISDINTAIELGFTEDYGDDAIQIKESLAG
jgi:tetratricopeptide (TPR) repeat protein